VATFGLPVLALVCVWLAASAHLWVLLWPALVMVAVSIAYLTKSPGAFGKRPDGTLPLWAWLVWGPWFVYMWIAHEGARTLTREPVANEVAPRIWVGRRPRAGELPPDVTIVVDLCAEFPAGRGVRDGRTYLTIPTLDATSPTPAELRRAIADVLATPGHAFIHCAFGHGRSATVAAGVLVARGDATLETVEAIMKAKRPRIGLNGIQRAALRHAMLDA
jgi:protein-tyrosine phosphatase